LFEVRPGGGESQLDALIRHLRAVGAPVLLVLDNFEHVAAAAVTIAELLERCERVTVLATSRARLNVSPEHEYQVAPLAIPDAGLVRRAAVAAEAPAVQLFVDRARASRAGFSLSDDNAPAVAQICQLLDGLPLAIELAAARIKVLPPEALLARISGRTLSLDGGARDLPARQQTLRATIDWSYELLSPAEQRLFSRLGVFVGGWSFEAAEAVCDAREDLGLDVFDGIASLVEKSLVRPLDADSAEPRFTMLWTLKQYALERLAAAGEAAEVRRAHAAYCLVLAEDAGTEAAAQAGWLAQCEVEHGNLRAAIDYLLESRHAEWAMRLASALLPFWQGRALLQEGREALTRALALAPDHELPAVRARALFSLGAIVHPMGDPESCARHERDALAIYRTLGDRDGQAVALNALGIAYHRMERYEDARGAFDEAVVIWRALGREQAVVRTLANLASVALDAGDAERAIALYRETHARCLETGDAAAVAWAVNGEARVEHSRGNAAAAARLYESALRQFESIRDSWGAGDSLLSLGTIAGESGGAGDMARARDCLRRALAIFREIGDIRGTIRIVEAAAHLRAGAGEGERALALAGAAAAARRTLNIPLPGPAQARLQAVLDDVRRTVDPARAGSAWMRGWSLSPEEALVLALED
jgi:predicted ATPase